MVAVGWSDGSWAVAPCCYARADNGNGTNGGTCTGTGSAVAFDDGREKACSYSSGDLATGDTGGLGPVLHIVHQVRQGCVREASEGECWGRERGGRKGLDRRRS